MKIIHVSDLHLDSKMKSNLDSIKAKERRDEILLTYQNMIQFAKENEVKIILIAGDLFDRKNITIKTKNIIINSIEENPNIDFIYLRGNHDEADIFSDLNYNLKNLKMFSRKNWITYKYNNITISGIEFGELTQYEIYNSLILNKNDFNIVTMHGQETLYNQKDKADIINLPELKNKNIDYLALGHIHTFKQEKLDTRGIYCYSGCLEGRGFDECGEKGFVLLDIDETTLRFTSKFIPFAKRKLYEIKVDISFANSTLEVERKIEEKIEKIEKQSLIKIILKGNVQIDAEKDLNYLERKYKNEYYFAKIYDETKLQIDYMSYENDASLKGEFIRLVLNQELTDEEKRNIITTGIKALSGEEIF